MRSVGTGVSFDAALDAAQGDGWLRDDGAGGDFSKPLYATQGRWLAWLLMLLGLSAKQNDGLATSIAHTLGLTLTVHGQARRQARSALRRVRGAALVLALSSLSLDNELWARLLCAGQLAGLWTTPWLWEVLSGQRVFPCRRTFAFDPGRSPPR